MQCSDAVKEINHYLLHGAHAGAEAPHAALTHVAGCRACLHTLAELGALWTDSPSLLPTGDPQLTCDECQELLPLYVDTVRKLRPGFAEFDVVAHHLERCSNCREEYALLAELTNAESFAAESVPDAAISVWQTVGERYQKLAAPLRLKAGQLLNAFADWPAALAALMAPPQLAPAPTLRRASRPGYTESAPIDYWVEVLNPPQNLSVRVTTVAAKDDRSTLYLKFASLAPAGPIAAAKITLRTGDNALLEKLPTDADGVVIFEDLLSGKYKLTLEYVDWKWDLEISV